MNKKDWETIISGLWSEWEELGKQMSGDNENIPYKDLCHKYKLLDILEKYGIDETGYHGFLYHEYAIVCLKCGSSKIVREDTYYKMMEHGVLYSGD